MTDIVEIIAQELYEDAPILATGFPQDWAGACRESTAVKNRFMCMAQVALSALHKAGYAVVPVEATEEMRKAGENALSDRYALRPAPQDTCRAMIQAAQKDREGD